MHVGSRSEPGRGSRGLPPASPSRLLPWLLLVPSAGDAPLSLVKSPLQAPAGMTLSGCGRLGVSAAAVAEVLVPITLGGAYLFTT